MQPVVRFLLVASSFTFGFALEVESSSLGSSGGSNQGRQLYKELLESLLSSYDPLIPPNADSIEDAVEVSVSLFLESISQLETKHQVLSLSAWFKVSWQDRRLSWDTLRYPVQTIYLPERRVWRPVLAIYNSLQPRDQLMDMKLHVAIRADGTVVWFPGDTLLLSCNVDISLYPFDTQTCDIMIGSWTMSEFQMNGTEADVQLHHFRDNAEWNVVGLAWERVSNAQIPNFPYWYFRYTVTLKRRWMFYALNVLLPVLLVSSLNSVVFALPVESGDKMSVSLTTFLTLAVFLALVRDSLPSNSDGVCYLVVYLALQTLLGVLAVAVSASVVYFHYRSDTYPLCGPSQDVEPVPEVNAHLVHHGDRANALKSSSADTGHAKRPKLHRAPRNRKRSRCQKLLGYVDRICLPLFLCLNVLSFTLYVALVAA